MQFLKEKGAEFCLIDAGTIAESHRVAELLGVTADDSGNVSVSSDKMMKAVAISGGANRNPDSDGVGGGAAVDTVADQR